MPCPGAEARTTRERDERHGEQQKRKSAMTASKKHPEHEQRGSGHEQEDGCALDGSFKAQGDGWPH